MTRPHTAVVLAAGSGRRLGALGTERPKAFIEIGGQPIIERSLALLAAAGVTRTLIVTGYRAQFFEVLRARVPGVELATGSLGHGRPVGSGMALAGKMKNQNYRVVVLMSDGECNEGSVWEAAMFAPARGLDNLAVVIDYNKWQATGRSNDVFRLDPLKDKWLAAGWSTHDIDGHDLPKLVDLLSRVPDGSGRPVAIIANTVKGKGVSFMEDNNDWHYRPPTDADLQNARKELGLL